LVHTGEWINFSSKNNTLEKNSNNNRSSIKNNNNRNNSDTSFQSQPTGSDLIKMYLFSDSVNLKKKSPTPLMNHQQQSNSKLDSSLTSTRGRSVAASNRQSNNQLNNSISSSTGSSYRRSLSALANNLRKSTSSDSNPKDDNHKKTQVLQRLNSATLTIVNAVKNGENESFTNDVFKESMTENDNENVVNYNSVEEDEDDGINSVTSSELGSKSEINLNYSFKKGLSNSPSPKDSRASSSKIMKNTTEQEIIKNFESNIRVSSPVIYDKKVEFFNNNNNNNENKNPTVDLKLEKIVERRTLSKSPPPPINTPKQSSTTPLTIRSKKALAMKTDDFDDKSINSKSSNIFKESFRIGSRKKADNNNNKNIFKNTSSIGSGDGETDSIHSTQKRSRRSLSSRIKSRRAVILILIIFPFFFIFFKLKFFFKKKDIGSKCYWYCERKRY
jgi:hypothetical protein